MRARTPRSESEGSTSFTIPHPTDRPTPLPHPGGAGDSFETRPRKGCAVEPDVISSWAWVFWLGLILVFIIIEVNTLEFTFLMLALGSVGGLVAGLVGAPWWGQLIIAALLALALVLLVRPPLLRALRRGGDPARSNVDALLGIGGTVTVDFRFGAGQVKLANGEVWTARVADGLPAASVEEGSRVVVTAIEGATAVVVPAHDIDAEEGAS
ncbi:NfeD family protein [Schumannella luteola]|nr:NfeD family protein [Schumannella luteola]